MILNSLVSETQSNSKIKKKIKENNKLRINSMPTNINYDTLDAILEEKSNFKIIQKVVTNKLSFWKYCLLAKWNQFPKVLVLPQIEIGYEYFKIVRCMVGKWFEIKNPITDLLAMELPNMS